MNIVIIATFCVILSIVAFVGISWSHCPNGIIKTLIQQERFKKQNKNT